MTEVLTSALLARSAGVRHAFFTRNGGVSRGVYRSLNVGVGSLDDPADVAENRRRAAGVFGAGPEALATCYQIHSANVARADGPWPDGRPRADGVATRTPGVICGALAADCAPVLMADSETRTVAAIHAGWRGALAGVIEAGVEAMVGLGARRGSIVAAVGPCIGPTSYEVGLEFLAAFKAVDRTWRRYFAPASAADKRLFDLPGFVLSRLAEAGVGASEWIGADTYADEGAFFSNRRAVHRHEADYGRLLSAIKLEN